MLDELQWQHVMDNLDCIKSNIQDNIGDGMTANQEFNGDFTGHVVKYLRGLACALEKQNDTMAL